MNEHQKENKERRLTIPDIESQIRNNQYKSKDELADHLLDLRKKGLLNINNTQIKELLDLFDELHKETDATLDMSNYSAVSQEKNDIIIAKEQDRVLTTLEGTVGYVDEFKSNQNDIIANNQDKNVSSDQVFEKMAKQEKDELSLLTLDEAFVNPNISTELLMKIKFFVTNTLENPNSFRINLETGIFYNIENKESYEVRKNEGNQTFEIYRTNEKIYENSIINQQEEIKNSNDKIMEQEENQLSNEETLNRPKVRRLVPNNPSNQNAAFTKIGFLVMSIITFVLLTLMTLLLMK